MPGFSFEEAMRASGVRVVAGVDEVGRGPLAGPVMAAAVIVPDEGKIRDYLLGQANDSKQLSAAKRMALAEFILERCAVGVGAASVDEIDSVNIRNATFIAMRRALEKVGKFDGVLVDGNALIPNIQASQKTIIGGDAVEIAIACASIVAKVRRDALMTELGRDFPHYGWHSNAGYGTAVHLKALREFGVSVHHRQSFAPVRELCDAAA